VKFLVDNQLPQALARWIAARGHQSLHVIEARLDEADDRVIWEHAVRESMIVVTKDEDFAKLLLMSPELLT
jgi:predicted nuclease of predicted toxin-antitoxin system